MFPGAKLLLTLFVLAGFSSAVGIPLSLTSQSSSAQGGGASPQFKVTKCVDSEISSLTTVNFGEDGVKEVCWTASDSSYVVQTAQNVNEEKYSDLFTNKWSSPKTSWSSSGVGLGNEWRNMCTNGQHYQFTIQNSGGQSGNDPEYVGWCSQGNSQENQKYVSIQGKDQSNSNLTIKVCSGSNCWQNIQSTSTEHQSEGDSRSQTTIHTLTSPSSTAWTQIIFKKKS